MTDWSTRVVAIVSASWGSDWRAGTRHVGSACAESFSEAGARVVVVDPDDAGMVELCGAIRARGGTADAISADLTDPASLERAREACAALTDRVDVLVNAHTAIEAGGVEASSYESWRRVVEFDLLGPVFAAKAFLPLLKRGTAPAVVHIGSVDGTLGHPLFPSYSAAKGGLVPLTHVMAHDFARHGIRVNCAARAMLAEAGAAALPEMAELEAQTALGRSGTPEELAAVVRFLASEEAAYVTGAVVPVDGGMSALTPGCAAHARRHGG